MTDNKTEIILQCEKCGYVEEAKFIPPTIEEIVNKYAKGDIHNMTCYKCPCVWSCEYRFDAYNTHGDCLAEK